MSCCKNNKPVTVSNSSGFIMKKKASPKFSKISSVSPFSLNGTSNNQNYIGNPNNAIAYVGCRDVDKTTKISVKNYSSYLKTKIVNNQLKCNPVNSFDCYKKITGNHGLNKHLNNYSNKDHDMRIQNLKNNVYECHVNNCNKISNNCSNKTVNNTPNVRNKFIINTCNITNQQKCVRGDVVDYSIYNKKKCLYNPPDAKVIAC